MSRRSDCGGACFLISLGTIWTLLSACGLGLPPRVGFRLGGALVFRLAPFDASRVNVCLSRPPRADALFSCHAVEALAIGSRRAGDFWLTGAGAVRISACTNAPCGAFGGVSRAAKGADCKSAGYAFVGSSPTSPTSRETRPASTLDLHLRRARPLPTSRPAPISLRPRISCRGEYWFGRRSLFAPMAPYGFPGPSAGGGRP